MTTWWKMKPCLRVEELLVGNSVFLCARQSSQCLVVDVVVYVGVVVGVVVVCLGGANNCRACFVSKIMQADKKSLSPPWTETTAGKSLASMDTIWRQSVPLEEAFLS